MNNVFMFTKFQKYDRLPAGKVLWLCAVVLAAALDVPQAQAQQTPDTVIVPDTVLFQPADFGSSGWFVHLRGGGNVWATENAYKMHRVLNVSGQGYVGVDNNQIQKPLRFYFYTNYANFIDHADLIIYSGYDDVLERPLATIPVALDTLTQFSWKSRLPENFTPRAGGSLQYIVRAYGKDGQIDETYPRKIKLLSPQKIDYRQSQTRFRGNTRGNSTDQQSNELVSSDPGGVDVLESIYGNSNLRIQNIRIIGSQVRVQGQNISRDIRELYINGQRIPVDLNNRFVANYILPAGPHQFRVKLVFDKKEVIRKLNINVSASHFFMVGIADLTASKNDIHGSVQPSIAGMKQFDDDMLAKGRLAFYLKSKLKGGLKITAQADTREREIKHMFDGFFGKDPQDLFRRLDPDSYYTTYGDNSRTYRDVNTQGKFYVRANWKKSELLWGNYLTGYSDNTLINYKRGLYGGAFRYNLPAGTSWGESKLQISAYGSGAQTAHSHNLLLATGGSVYYLKHMDILPGSERLVVELRDGTTGLTKQTITLRPDVDYEIDYLQGRLILKRPVSQIVYDNDIDIIRNAPQGSLRHIIRIDYEYIPRGLELDNLTFGGRGKVWLGDHIGLGGTYINEGRGSVEDYQLYGGDLTLRASRSTYIKAEIAKSDEIQAPAFFSYDGGLTFTQQIQATGSRPTLGEAYSLDGQLGFATLFAGSDSSYFVSNPWTIGVWWKKQDGGYSGGSRFYTLDTKEYGARLHAQVGGHVQMEGEVSKLVHDYPVTPTPYTAAITGQKLVQGKFVTEYRINNHHKLTAEVRSVDESSFGGYQGEAVLGGLGYQLNLNDGLQLYGMGQTELWKGSGYRDNDRMTVGTHYLWNANTTIGGEYSHGARGDVFSVNASHNFTQNYQIYTRYGWSADYDNNTLFGPRQPVGFTVGQRWRATKRLSLFQETQQIQSSARTGLGNTLGLNFIPANHWRLGLRFEGAKLDDPQSNKEDVKRRAATFTVGRQDINVDLSSKFEYRGDYGMQDVVQLVTTQRIRYKISNSWRVAGRLNYADTDNKNSNFRDARFIESNLGISYRPWNTTKWGILSKFTYLYDRQTMGQLSSDAYQLTGSSFDQKSVVASLELIYQPWRKIELAVKGAMREGKIRNRADAPDRQWYESIEQFLSFQLRFHVWKKWDALGEARLRRNIQANDSRSGFLVAINRRITDFLQFGVGYNFTDFSDDLTDLDFNDRGFFINIIGFY